MIARDKYKNLGKLFKGTLCLSVGFDFVRFKVKNI